jgi:hypothetical protein
METTNIYQINTDYSNDAAELKSHLERFMEFLQKIKNQVKSREFWRRLADLIMLALFKIFYNHNPLFVW